jgi:hypothetical protein
MAIPWWVNLAGWVLSLLFTVLLYRDARVRLRALASKLAMLAPHADDAAGPATPRATRPGDDGRRLSSRPSPPVEVLDHDPSRR